MYIYMYVYPLQKYDDRCVYTRKEHCIDVCGHQGTRIADTSSGRRNMKNDAHNLLRHHVQDLKMILKMTTTRMSIK